MLTSARLAEIRALLADEHRTHDQLEDALQELLDDRVALLAVEARFVVRWNGGSEPVTTDYAEAQTQAMAALVRGHHNVGVASYHLQQVDWVRATEFDRDDPR
ncbi:hypothetical protein ACFC0S_16425 [Streptomyces sp. NPDC056084]|uniref:hypothetical protein n=1 Tax=unclassified Streptomyces TaxID=2593676 RepID=UPI0035DBF9C6